MTVAGYQIQLFATDARGSVRWRLLSGNHREVGRGAGTYADEQSCQTALAGNQRESDAFVAKLRRTDPYRWRWELHRDGMPVVVAGHSYDRQIRCEMALSQFREHFPLATVRSGVVLCGARRWGSVTV